MNAPFVLVTDVPSVSSSVVVAVQLSDVFVFRPKDFLFLLPADLIFVSLVEMKIWSSLHRGTTISTSGLCATAKKMRFQ